MQESFDHLMGAAVPFTVLIAPNGDILYQEQGDVTILALRRAILANLPDAEGLSGPAGLLVRAIDRAIFVFVRDVTGRICSIYVSSSESR